MKEVRIPIAWKNKRIIYTRFPPRRFRSRDKENKEDVIVGANDLVNVFVIWSNAFAALSEDLGVAWIVKMEVHATWKISMGRSPDNETDYVLHPMHATQ